MTAKVVWDQTSALKAQCSNPTNTQLGSFLLIHHSMNPVTWGDFKELHDCELLYKNKEKSWF